MKPTSSSPPRPGRNLTEKNRRQQMKDLYRRLASLVSRKNTLPLLEKSPAFDLLGEATDYIKQLEGNVNELKARKDSLQLPVVIISVNESETGEILEINIVCGSENKNLKMHKVFCILKEEGVEVVSAYSSTMGLKIYHTILSKAFSPRLGMDTNRVQERLKNFISSI